MQICLPQMLALYEDALHHYQENVAAKARDGLAEIVKFRQEAIEKLFR